MLVSTLQITLLTALAAQLGQSAYTLKDSYTPQNFFDKFNFFTKDDPTHGNVTYVSRDEAKSMGLVNTDGGKIYMGVQHKTAATTRYRESVRITSKTQYNGGLFLLDLSHMPVGCGTWPAYWMVANKWPKHGEIDMIEGVHTQAQNQMTLHTRKGCMITDGGFKGKLLNPDCYADPADNEGCGIQAPGTNTYGEGLNANKGGVHATQWTGDSISMWFWPHDKVPQDVTRGKPTPGRWGEPIAKFKGPQSNIKSYISDQHIIFDNTFCGDWAGAVWTQYSNCVAKAPDCASFVRDNPQAFANAFWSINSLKVYQNPGADSAVENNEDPVGIDQEDGPRTKAPIPSQ